MKNTTIFFQIVLVLIQGCNNLPILAATNDPCECEALYMICLDNSNTHSEEEYDTCVDNHEYQKGLCEDAEDRKKCETDAKNTFDICNITQTKNWEYSDKWCDIEKGGCHETCNESTESSSAGTEPLTPCPGGTKRGPLGNCLVTFLTIKDATMDRGGCPPGWVRGPLDACVPEKLTLIAEKTQDGFLVICPPGTKPSPIDGGCVLDPAGPQSPGGEIDPDLRWPHCPPGTAPDPSDGGCIPIIELGDVGNHFTWKMAHFLNKTGQLDSPELPEYLLSKLNAMKVEDPEAAIERTAGLLEAEIVEVAIPESP